jgi:hypothetical protein
MWPIGLRRTKNKVRVRCLIKGLKESKMCFDRRGKDSTSSWCGTKEVVYFSGDVLGKIHREASGRKGQRWSILRL